MQFRILGPLEVIDDGEPLKLAGAKQRALLALLLLRANQVVSRDALIDGLWGEKPPRGANHSLEAHVSRLRKLLRNGQNVVLTRPGGYVLQVDAGDLDLPQFEQLADEGRAALRDGDEQGAVVLLRRALSLWRGGPFEDVDIDSSALPEIRTLEERRLAAYEDLIDAELAQGRSTEVLPELERLVRLHPLRERLHAQLMVALYRCGRQADALEAYRDAHRRFSDELGIEPGPDLRAIQQAILRQDAALQGRPRESDSRGPRHGRSPRPTLLVAAIALAVGATGLTASLVEITGSSSPAALPPNSVAMIDPQSGKILHTVSLGSRPSSLAVAAGRVWVASLENRTITRIDAESGKVVDVLGVDGTPTAIAGGAGAVWVTDGIGGYLLRLDPRSGRAMSSRPDGPAEVILGGHPAALAIDRSGIWIVNDSAVQRVDPATQDVRWIEIGTEPQSVSVGEGSVWVASALGQSLTRIDSANATLVGQPVILRSRPTDIAFGAGSVWLAEPEENALARIDPRTKRSQATITVDRSPSAALVIGQSVWVLLSDHRSLEQVDARSDRVVREVSLQSPPVAATADRDHLWVATAEPEP